MQTCHQRFPLRHWVACGSGFLLLLSLGCSSDRNAAPVSGTVTSNGEPQEGILIYFEPVMDEDADPLKGISKSYARTDADGRFKLNFMDVDKDRPGAIVGNHTVTADDERTFGDTAGEPATGRTSKSRVPRGWKMSFAVPQSGTTTADFELSEIKK